MAKKILLADDSITIQKVVELTFSDGDYEVTAVNNGAKAIQKLNDMRPDIILSDIIMPEKNGYEVCEFVKSHPDFRSIPVVLLTGTFEPFDPDRADKAGCDAVVTKPFESQSLIHKVEELIDQSRAAAPAAASAPAAAAAPPEPPASEPSPWAEEPAAAPSGFSPAPGFTPAPAPEPPAAFTHDADVFSAAPESASQQPMPIESPAESPFGETEYAGETRSLPRMTFDELSNMAAAAPSAPSAPPPAAEPSPWDEQPSQQVAAGGFDEVPAASEPVAPPPSDEDAESPFGAPPPAEEFSGETRAFPRMTLDQIHAAVPSQPAPPPAPEPAAPSPWDEQPAFSGETKAFPRMSFEDLQAAASQAGTTPTPSPWGEAAAPAAPPWGEPEQPSATETSPVPPAPAFEQPEPPAFAPSAPEPPAAEAEPAWAAAAAQPAPVEASAAPGQVELTDEQIDKIARRVVQLMSDQVVKNIAWEVIPDLAEMVVKERIRQLEAEA